MTMTRGRSRVLIIDDDALMLESMSDVLKKKGYTVRTYRDAEKALDVVKGSSAEIAVVDLKMPGMNGLEFLRKAKESDRDLPIVMMTAYSTIGTAVEAMKLGAYDYIQKPFDMEELDIVIQRALSGRRLQLQQAYLAKRQSDEVVDRELIGESNAMKHVREMIEKVARSDSTVLVTGASGTGKELVARHIHHCSPRSRQLFVAVNAAAVPDSLLESELFGHTKGAFTSADRDHKGLFQTADGATLFLDEISQTSPTMQVKLLRAIEENEIRPVGSSSPVFVDVRLIVSSNVDLADAVREGSFREDLYYRLNVFPIGLPPLRSRKEDIPRLAEHFLLRLATRARKEIRSFSPQALDMLCNYRWPGNVRELEHVVERAVIIEEREEITPESLFLEGSAREPGRDGFLTQFMEMPIQDAKNAFEKHYLRERLRGLGRRGSMTALAKELGIHRTTLYDLIERHGLDLEQR
jgi:DNA-binding NtrC family response regulator